MKGRRKAERSACLRYGKGLLEGVPIRGQNGLAMEALEFGRVGHGHNLLAEGAMRTLDMSAQATGLGWLRNRRQTTGGTAAGRAEWR